MAKVLLIKLGYKVTNLKEVFQLKKHIEKNFN